MFREPYGKNGENVFYKECMRKSCREDRIFLYIKGMSHISVTQGGKSLWKSVLFKNTYSIEVFCEKSVMNFWTENEHYWKNLLRTRQT